MKRSILCHKCGVPKGIRDREVSELDACMQAREQVVRVGGRSKKDGLYCDICACPINYSDEVIAESVYVSPQVYFEWEQEYLLIDGMFRYWDDQ